jgi:sugar phosphate permease
MRYTVLLFLCLVTVIAYVQRSAFNGTTRIVERDLGLGPSDMGYVMGAWYLAYALCQLPSGSLADRLGSKRGLILFSFTWSMLTAVVGVTTSFPMLLLLWGLMGAAQAGIFPCCTKAIGATFPRTEQAFASGTLACSMSLGGALAPAITAQLIGTLAWQEIFVLYAIPGLVWGLAFTLIVKNTDPPPAQKQPSPDEDEPDWHAPPTPPPEKPAVAAIQWSRLVTDRQMLILCLQQFLRAGPMVLFYTWFARVLSETRGLDELHASSLASWPPFVGLFGGLIGGLLSDAILRRTDNSRLARQGMTFVLLVIGTFVSLAAFFTPEPRTAVFLMSIAAFCGMAGGVSGYSLAISYGGSRVATVFATMNMSGNLGASFFPIAVGWIVSTTGNWNYVLLLFSLMFACGAICWAVLNPRGTLFDEGSETA